MAEYTSTSTETGDNLEGNGLSEQDAGTVLDLLGDDANDGVDVAVLGPNDPVPADAEVVVRELADGSVEVYVVGQEEKVFVGTSGDDSFTGDPGGFSTGKPEDGDGVQSYDIVSMGEGDDVAQGRWGKDILRGGEGDDTLNGGAGRDVLRGQQDDDVLRGGDRADKLFGGDGDDKLFGNRADDLLNGGAGDDTLRGGLGDDTLKGGAGDDVVYGGAHDDTIIASATSGDDTIQGGTGEDRLVIEGSNMADATVVTDAGVTTITFANGTTMSVTEVEYVEFDDGEQEL